MKKLNSILTEKTLFVGGSFDTNGGRRSKIVELFARDLKIPANNIYNGGDYDSLEAIINKVSDYDLVFWWANVPNDLPKIRNVKEINPKALLVASKNNINNRYEFPTLINRALGEKANLVVEFVKESSGIYKMRVFDPLGAVWYEGTDIDECVAALTNRLSFLFTITRGPSVHLDSECEIEIPNEEAFFTYVKEIAETFHQIIPHDETVTRFLGNSSFRCQRGFPSFRYGNLVFVSRRNVDKRYICKESFVPTFLADDTVYYYGDNKPSVDTPIQLRLYERLPNINYMVHAHCYVEGAPFTTTPVPCGGIEEVNEVMSVIEKHTTEEFYAINLIGHGCIIMANDVSQFYGVKFIGRDVPEKFT